MILVKALFFFAINFSYSYENEVRTLNHITREKKVYSLQKKAGRLIDVANFHGWQCKAESKSSEDQGFTTTVICKNGNYKFGLANLCSKSQKMDDLTANLYSNDDKQSMSIQLVCSI